MRVFRNGVLTLSNTMNLTLDKAAKFLTTYELTKKPISRQVWKRILRKGYSAKIRNYHTGDILRLEVVRIGSKYDINVLYI
jgi:hypothetical protein